jgi:DNA (cytosine-5)-methyltransferase 1
MGKIKVLNLYAGIGGNRKLWENVEVTAVENNQEIADIYKHFFPHDKVVVADAHQYLLDHFKEFDFIWSSPPCPTHSSTNRFLHAQGVIRYPEMGLYQEIIFLKEFFKGSWTVENVISYYEPLIRPWKRERHYFWCNFIVDDKKKDLGVTITNSRASTRRTKEQYISMLEKYHGFDFSGIDVTDTKKVEMLSNCVRPELGLHVFNCAFKNRQSTLTSIPPAPEGKAGITER